MSRGKPQTRNVGLIRVLSIMRVLSEEPRTLAQLVNTFRVAPRTIWRDLRALEAAGFEVLKSQNEQQPALYRVRAPRRKTR